MRSFQWYINIPHNNSALKWSDIATTIVKLQQHDKKNNHVRWFCQVTSQTAVLTTRRTLADDICRS